MSDDPTGTRIRCHRANGINQMEGFWLPFFVAPAKAGAQATGAVPALDARFRVASRV
jgi:hypothetical protein